MNAYRRWLRQQLAALVDHPDPDESHYDGIADVIAEARSRAADAGLPDAVKACRVRRGGLTVSLAREILAGCLAACPRPTDRKHLTPPLVATQSWPMTDQPLREPEQIRQDCARKLRSVETSGVFSAILGCRRTIARPPPQSWCDFV